MLPSLRTTLIALVGGSMIATAPAHADDTKTGLIAGLGVAAATGKTSLGDGGGKIEAGLLSADAFQQAAAVISAVVRDTEAKGRRIVVLPGDTTIDLLSPALITERLDELSNLVSVQCKKNPEGEKKEENKVSAESVSSAPRAKFLVSDLTGAALTDATIGGIALEADNRRLVNALLMDAGHQPITLSDQWQTWPGTDHSSSSKQAQRDRYENQITVVGEGAAPATKSSIREAYNRLHDALVIAHAQCWTKEAITARDAADALIANLTDASKGPSVLSTAIQIEAATGDRGAKGVVPPPPLLLRVAIEQVGGTSIARSGILYTFGWPDAVTVSAGLLGSGPIKLVAVGVCG